MNYGTTNGHYVDIQSNNYININQDFFLPSNAIISDVLIGVDNEIIPIIDNNYGSTSSIRYDNITKGFNVSIAWELKENGYSNDDVALNVSIQHIGNIYTNSNNFTYDNEVILKNFTINNENYIITTILTEEMQIKQKLNQLGL